MIVTDAAPATDLRGSRVEIRKELDVASARLASRRLAADLGFGEVALHAIVTCVSELATNVLIHGRGGAVELRPVAAFGEQGFEVTASDSGPGFGDVIVALRDGFSTAGGLGGGLPAVNRLMHELEIWTAPGEGSRVTARRFLGERRRAPRPADGWTRVENDAPFGPFFARRNGATVAFQAED